MKFPRRAHLFQGRLDAAPFAGVFFLLTIFLAFESSLVYVPGLPIQVGAPETSEARTKTLLIDAQGRFHFEKLTLTEPEFAKTLRLQAADTNTLQQLIIRADPALTNGLLARLHDLTRELNLKTQWPGLRIELPRADSLPGIAGPSVMVAIDLTGQLYYDHQIITEPLLSLKLAAAAQKAREPLTLLVVADKSVEYEVIVRLGALARDAGLRQVMLATRPPLFTP